MIYCIHIKRRENCFCNENKISLIFDELITYPKQTWVQNEK
jgi:hypothetical protein